jgi:hypothetical protein
MPVPPIKELEQRGIFMRREATSKYKLLVGQESASSNHLSLGQLKAHLC